MIIIGTGNRKVSGYTRGLTRNILTGTTTRGRGYQASGDRRRKAGSIKRIYSLRTSSQLLEPTNYEQVPYSVS